MSLPSLDSDPAISRGWCRHLSAVMPPSLEAEPAIKAGKPHEPRCRDEMYATRHNRQREGIRSHATLPRRTSAAMRPRTMMAVSRLAALVAGSQAAGVGCASMTPGDSLPATCENPSSDQTRCDSCIARPLSRASSPRAANGSHASSTATVLTLTAQARASRRVLLLMPAAYCSGPPWHPCALLAGYRDRSLLGCEPPSSQGDGTSYPCSSN